MSATQNGTCQVCGRLQAYDKNKLAKHGYTVEHGWFNGVCPGSGHKALEVERSFADEVAASVNKQADEHAANIKAIDAGKMFPKQAKNGQREQYDRQTSYGMRKDWRDVMVPYAEAPEHHQQEAVQSLRWNNERTMNLARSTALGITDRANNITGKRELQKRATEEKKVIVAGTKLNLRGKIVTVIKVEDKTAWGVGPYLNGNVMPHAFYDLGDGKVYAYPLRLIRQASIVG